MLVPLPQPYDFELSTERFQRLRTRPREPLARGRPAPRRRWSRGADRGGPGRRRGDPDDPAIEAYVLSLLGAPFDLDAFAAWAAGEPTLAPLVAALPGFRPPLEPDPFEALVTRSRRSRSRSSPPFAIRSRFVERFGTRATHAYAFPSGERVARASEPELVAVGFSGRKAEYVIGLARSDLDLDALAALPDEEVAARLVALRGLGEWTADWFLARHLGRPHAWPAGDLGLRKAVAAFYGDVPDLRAFGARFHPFQNLTAHYLLTGLRLVPPMTIRHGTDDDLEAVRRLRELWNAESPAPPPWADVSWDANRAEFERAVAANALFLAEEDGEPVGFVAAWLEDHVARIGDLYVAEASRRHGIGRALVDAVIENLRARRGDAPDPDREPRSARFLRAARLPRGVAQRRPPARRARGRRRPLVRLDPRPDRRPRRGRARRAPVRAAPARRLARQSRDGAAQRLDRRVRRRLRPRPRDAAAAGDASSRTAWAPS